MNFFETAKKVGVGYLGFSAMTTMTGTVFGGMGGALYGLGKGLVTNERIDTKCLEFTSEATTFPGKIVENVNNIATHVVCDLSNFGANFAFVATSIAWNTMNYAVTGGAYGSLPVSYPFFIAYEYIYNEMTPKNPTTSYDGDIKDDKANEKTNTFGL